MFNINITNDKTDGLLRFDDKEVLNDNPYLSADKRFVLIIAGNSESCTIIDLEKNVVEQVFYHSLICDFPSCSMLFPPSMVEIKLSLDINFK